MQAYGETFRGYHEASFSGVYHDFAGLVEAMVPQLEDECGQYLQKIHECRLEYDKDKYDRSEAMIAFISIGPRSGTLQPNSH